MSSLDFDPDIQVADPEEPALELLERRWFAAMAAIRKLQSECELLRGVMQIAEDSRRRSELELTRMEALRDALQDRLNELEESRAPGADPGAALAARAAGAPLEVMSAA